MRVAKSLICLDVFVLLVSSGCVPGGLIMPVPLPHIERPMVRGTLLLDGKPVSDQTVLISSELSRFPGSCADSQSKTATNRFGEFEFPLDRASWTVFWSDAQLGVSVCAPSLQQEPIWRALISNTGHPRIYPKTIDIACNVGGPDAKACVSSLDDINMPDCTDDLDYQYPTGWQVAKTGGLFSGRCVSFHENGQILERADFVAGVRIGPWVGFDEDGTREDQSFYIDGRRRRESIWYENGQLSRQTHYRATSNVEGMPVRHGLHTAWSDDGEIELLSCWQDGVRVEISYEKCVFD